jgi:DNA-directed RNA polymerase specialized sigma24 family protein
MRNFVSKSVKNFLCNWHDQVKAAKRRPKGKLLSFDVGSESDEQGPLPIPSDSETPDEAYMREWARSTMSHALEKMARACREEGLAEWWEVFRRHVSEASQFGNPSYEQTAASLNWDVEKVRRTLHHARRKFASVVHDVLRDSVENESEIEAELDDLRRFFIGRTS